MMKSAKKKIVSLFSLLLLATFLTACTGKEFAYQDSNEMKPGPGLISGEDGVFTIYEGSLGTGGEK